MHLLVLHTVIAGQWYANTVCYWYQYSVGCNIAVGDIDYCIESIDDDGME